MSFLVDFFRFLFYVAITLICIILLVAGLSYANVWISDAAFRHDLSDNERIALENARAVADNYRVWMDAHDSVPPYDSLMIIATRSGTGTNPFTDRPTQLCGWANEAEMGDIVFIGASYTPGERPPLAFGVKLGGGTITFTLSPDNHGRIEEDIMRFDL